MHQKCAVMLQLHQDQVIGLTAIFYAARRDLTLYDVNRVQQ